MVSTSVIANSALTVEAGDPSAIEHRPRVAVIASFAPSLVATKSLSALAEEFTAAGFATVVVHSSSTEQALAWPHGLPQGTIVCNRENEGYDFGSWASALATWPGIAGAETLVLTNDSLAGPFSSLSHVIESATTSNADVWGAVRSHQFVPHLQSYMLAFRNGVMGDRALRRFWGNLPRTSSKAEIIERYELALSELLWAEGYTTDAYVDAHSLNLGDKNPAITGWRRLLDAGLPMLKRQLVREPDLVSDGHELASVVSRMFGTDLYDWVPEDERMRST